MIKFLIALVVLIVGFQFLIKVVKASTKLSTESKHKLVKIIVTGGFATLLACITLFFIVILF